MPKGIYPRKSLVERFNEKYRVMSNGCWQWQGFVNIYGQIENKGTSLAHRVSWIIHKGKIPRGMCVCHKCDNPPCVNPDHLFLGTLDDNNKDMVNKGRYRNFNSYKTHCHNGHELTKENVYLKLGKFRECRICSRISKTKYAYKVKMVNMNLIKYPEPKGVEL